MQTLEHAPTPAAAATFAARPIKKSLPRRDSLLGAPCAKALGWFSVGLGIGEVFAPRKMAEITGVGANVGFLPVLGTREIVSGIGLLNNPHSSAWMWSRVAGDVVDLGFLGMSTEARGADPVRIGLAAAAVAGVTALDFLCARELAAQQCQGRMSP
jgi:hypothetical protein